MSAGALLQEPDMYAGSVAKTDSERFGTQDVVVLRTKGTLDVVVPKVLQQNPLGGCWRLVRRRTPIFIT